MHALNYFRLKNINNIAKSLQFQLGLAGALQSVLFASLICIGILLIIKSYLISETAKL